MPCRNCVLMKGGIGQTVNEQDAIEERRVKDPRRVGYIKMTLI